ncbi:LCP family protein [Psychrobacillus vulpis]|uniref:LytR family transcriptional regulator n=1 Tax=Psychrobacillus vulpis TaxID=2325572 RepID=A0A544TV78_9BACI|nr:LCP family protein [Psychrobacillus vulpis]TQR21336.1 LytR family transcriptional regulator [Psychrobacillus vulpis]
MKKRIIWIIVAASFFIGCIVYASSFYNEVSTTLETIHEPEIRQVSKLRTTEVELVKKQPFSLLLLGVDERENDKGRSDTIIVITANPSTNSTKIISIPRDTYTEIIGKNKVDKINHAYAFGGMDMALHSVENLLNIPIDYVVQVNMESFLEIVDIVGGVTVENANAFQVDDFIFDEGTIHLDGEQALSYVRMRMDDPLGDFGRQARQKQVLQAVLQKGASINSLWNYKDILSSLQKNLRTNMTFEQMIDIQKGYKSTLNQMESLSFEKGEGKKIDGIWYFMMDEEELKNVTTKLKEHLEIE